MLSDMFPKRYEMLMRASRIGRKEVLFVAKYSFDVDAVIFKNLLNGLL